MYDLLGKGAFGNTIPVYHRLEDWLDSGDADRYEFWGVRTQTPGGPCRLMCPKCEVFDTFRRFRPQTPNVSLMVTFEFGATLHADVFLGESGLQVYGVEYPDRTASWRKVMPEQGRTYSPLQSTLLLKKHLNANSYADLLALMELYPNHVIELSTLGTCYGTVPGRNAVIWEVRFADGSYEKW